MWIRLIRTTGNGKRLAGAVRPSYPGVADRDERLSGFEELENRIDLAGDEVTAGDVDRRDGNRQAVRRLGNVLREPLLRWPGRFRHHQHRLNRRSSDDHPLVLDEWLARPVEPADAHPIQRDLRPRGVVEHVADAAGTGLQLAENAVTCQEHTDPRLGSLSPDHWERRSFRVESTVPTSTPKHLPPSAGNRHVPAR